MRLPGSFSQEKPLRNKNRSQHEIRKMVHIFILPFFHQNVITCTTSETTFLFGFLTPTFTIQSFLTRKLKSQATFISLLTILLLSKCHLFLRETFELIKRSFVFFLLYEEVLIRIPFMMHWKLKAAFLVQDITETWTDMHMRCPAGGLRRR